MSGETVQFIGKGEKKWFGANVYPANATNKEIVWTSSDSRIATVDSDGTITAVANGKCRITATTKDGQKEDFFYAEVIMPNKNTYSFTLSTYSIALSYKGAKKHILTFRKDDEDSLYPSAYNWSSSDESIATVENGTVTAVSEGICTVTCSCYYNPEITQSCTVYVELLGDSPETEVTVQGVTFDMKYFPKMITVGDSMECLSIIPESEIDPGDITYTIQNGNAQMLCSPDTPNVYSSSDEQYKYNYYVSDWKNMMAYIDVSYDPGMYLKYRVEIYNQLKTGTFPVSVYYKNTLIRTCKVIVVSVDQRMLEYREWMDDLEKKAWTSDMSVEDKLLAVKDYIYNNYTYTTDGYMCNDGAKALLYAARDLGLNARYRFVGRNYDYQKGLGDVYYHFGSAFCGGHVCTIVTIGDKQFYIETQGHAG